MTHRRTKEERRKMVKKVEAKTKVVTIAPPNLKEVTYRIRGTSVYAQHKFSAKAKEAIKRKQEEGSTAKKGQKREPKNFQDDYLGAMHLSSDGWRGIPANAFRNAMISACRICGFQMTRAKLAIFIVPDGIDDEESMPLVRIASGEPQRRDIPVRLETGVIDIRPLPVWEAGWEAGVTVRFDADMFTKADIENLLARAGMQVGIGEGRPDSRNSAGLGWGTFEIVG